MSKATKKKCPPYRYKLLKIIHALAREMGIDDEVYRDFLAAHFDGRRSCTELTDPEIGEAIRKLRRYRDTLHGYCFGSKPKKYDELGNRGPEWATPKQLRYIEALWRNVCRAKNWQKTLRSLLHRLANVSDMRMLHSKGAHAVIEALKAMDGGVHKGGIYD